MKGLLLKDFYTAIKYCKSIIIISIVFSAASVFASGNVFFIIYPAVLAGFAPLTLVSFDEREDWSVYCDTLPCSRAQAVSSKYIIGILFELAVVLLSLTAQLIKMLATDSFSWSNISFLLMSFCLLGTIGPGILLPCVFKYGAEKGRIVQYIVVGVLCALASGLTISMSNSTHSSSTVLAAIADITQARFTPAVCAALCAIELILYAVSWRISVAVYLKREL